MPERLIRLPPTEPGLDERTRERRVVLQKIQGMTPEQIVSAGIRAGITKPDGGLAEPYAPTESDADLV